MQENANIHQNRTAGTRKRLGLLALSSLLSLSPGWAQQGPTEHPESHKPLMNAVWAVFDQLAYKVGKNNGKTTYTPHFPPALARLHGQSVTIQGYMVPMRAGRRHSTFLLSVLPLQQCMFCGRDGIPAMTEIRMAYSAKVGFSETPITVKGTVFLNSEDKKHAEIQLRNAIILPKNGN